MGWILKQQLPKIHKCEPPMRLEHFTFPASVTKEKTMTYAKNLPNGVIGDLWRCDSCGILWTIKTVYYGNVGPGTRTWVEAGWFQRMRNRKK